MADFWSTIFGKGASNFWGGLGGAAVLNFGLPMVGAWLEGGQRRRAEADWRKRWDETLSPQWMSDRISANLGIMNQTMTGQRSGIMATQNMFQNNMERKLAATGMNRSGIGALASTAAGSMGQQMLSDLYSEGRRGAIGMAYQDRNAMLQMLQMGPQYQTNQWNEAFALGAQGFGKSYMDWQRMRNGYPPDDRVS